MPNPALKLETFGGSFFGFEFSWMTLTSWLWTIVMVLVAGIMYFLFDKLTKKAKFVKKIDKIAK
jgi:membrane protein insertase Oxa1/YidC/SpoIIIJ